MNNIWIVFLDNNGAQMLSVHSTIEKAEEAIQHYLNIANHRLRDEFYVEAWRVDHTYNYSKEALSN
jgi:hypothetical protein